MGWRTVLLLGSISVASAACARELPPAAAQCAPFLHAAVEPRGSSALVAPTAPSVQTPAVVTCKSTTGDRPNAHVVVRWACDDKYNSPETCDEAAWVATLGTTAMDHTLLEPRGPGPMGAEWNGHGVMVVITPAFVENVSIGGRRLSVVSVGELKFHRAPFDVWWKTRQVGKTFDTIPVMVDGQLVGAVWYASGE